MSIVRIIQFHASGNEPLLLFLLFLLPSLFLKDMVQKTWTGLESNNPKAMLISPGLGRKNSCSDGKLRKRIIKQKSCQSATYIKFMEKTRDIYYLVD